MILPAITQTRGDFAPLLNKIHQCDAMELLRRLPDASIDMVLCDLPYGVTACEWDTVIPIEPMWKELRRVVKRRAAIVLTATQPFTSRLVSSNYEMFGYSWVWQKQQPTGFLDANRKPMKAHEDILIFYKSLCHYYPQDTKPVQIKSGGQAKSGRGLYNAVSNPDYVQLTGNYPRSVLLFDIDNIGTVHPTQKPVALFEYLIKTYTQENEIVLDMTCGSGTTAIAARKTGRQFICGDLSAEYVEVARKRLQNTDPYQATILPDGSKQLSLFEAVQ